MELGVISAHRTVVLEGGDGVGKSTLAQQLARDLGFTIVQPELRMGLTSPSASNRSCPDLSDSSSIAAS